MSSDVRKVSAGLYEHQATGLVIVKTEDLYEGPRGGARPLWEIGERTDDRGIVILGKYLAFHRLKDAVEELNEEVRSNV